MMRRSECITAVMVFPAAIAWELSAAESAKTDRVDAIARRFQPEMGNIRSLLT
jgi:hypothetical protein